MKHKHAELIKAWADGAKIEWMDYKGEWQPIGCPAWHPNTQYRITKPEDPSYVELKAEDPHAKLKAAFKAGKKIEARANRLSEVWYDCNPTWTLPLSCYRVKSEVDPHAELKAAFKVGKAIEYYSSVTDSWQSTSNPYWGKDTQYRIKPEVDPYAELKAAHKAGKVIQMQDHGDGNWVDMVWFPLRWNAPVSEYRIKPEDPYVELKAAFKAGKTIQFDVKGPPDWMDSKWVDLDFPTFKGELSKYRIKPEDPYAELKAAYKAGKTIELYLGPEVGWFELSHQPLWSSNPKNYRAKDKYAELKAAYKAGKTIQINVGAWVDINWPCWDADVSKYRIK